MLALSLVGCAAEVSVVRRDANGGELLLRGPHAPAAIEARTLIVEHCGGRYQLLRAATNDTAPASELSGHGQIGYRCATLHPTRGDDEHGDPAEALAQRSD